MNPRVEVFESPEAACQRVADELEALIRERAAQGRQLVLGVATGSTPLPLYRELVARHRAGGLSFANVVTFNLDEYLGLPAEHPQSYHAYMRRHWLDHVDLPPEHSHLPAGEVPPEQLAAHCEAYEEKIRAAGGIDFQWLGIGRSGHIGFNEPGTPLEARTHVTELAATTREDAVAQFGRLEAVPRRAITMGCGTILEARRVLLMAWGKAKAEIVARALSSEVSPELPASGLQRHANATWVLDREAAAALGSC